MKPFFFAAFAAATAGGLFLSAPLPVRAQANGTDFSINKGLIPPLRGMLSAGAKGFLVEPPQLIAETGVQEVRAYPDGNRAVVLRVYYRPTPDFLLSDKSATFYKPQDVPGEASITIWNAITRKASVVWRQRIEPGDLFTFQTWGILQGANGADRVLVGAALEKREEGGGKPASQQTMLLVDADKNVVRQVGLSPSGLGYSGTLDYVLVKPSPTLPFAALTGPGGAAENLLRFMRPDGSLTKPIVLPGEVRWRDWQNNGTVLRGTQAIPSPTDPKTFSVQWFDADPQAGTLTPIERPKTRSPYIEPPAPETISQLTLTTRPPLPLSGTKESSVWLQAKSDNTAATEEGAKKASSSEAILLCTEGEPVFLLPRAALFLSNGALYAAPIQTVNDTTLAQIKKKQSRDTSIRTTKQIGLAFMGYLQDNDIKFPASASGLSDAIGQYLKDPHLLDGFVYTPPMPLGQAAMDNVAQVVLGWLPGDGGKMVLYADGHVKWQDNP